MVRHRIQGPAAEARQLGTRLAERLLADGGDVILKEIYGQAS
jgi:hypothetical protein